MPDPRALTDAQARAVQILVDRGPLTPGIFAQLMWPDSPGWKRPAKCGPYGSHQGGGMYLAGGGYLGRLRKLGLATWLSPRRGYRASRLGEQLLEGGFDA